MTYKPKFKTSWEISTPIDKKNSNEIAEYGGIPLKIVDLGGKSTLMTVKKEQKMEFLDPATFKKTAKSITLASGKETISSNKYLLVNIKGEWCFIYIKTLDDKEFRNEVVCLNISTKQRKVLDKVRCSINDIIALENATGHFLFVAYSCKSDQISQYNLNTLEKIADLDLEVCPYDADFQRIDIDGQTRLMVDYWDDGKRNYTAIIDPVTFSFLKGNCNERFKHTYLREDGQVVLTTKYIDDKTFSHTDIIALPTADSRYKIHDMEIVDTGGGQKKLFVIVSFFEYPANGRDIAYKTHLLAFNTESRKQEYDLFLCDDPQNNKYVKVTFYKSKLIFSTTQDRKTVNQVYDLADLETPPYIIRDENGNEDIGYNRDNLIVRYDGKDYLMLHKNRIGSHRRYYSLDSFQKSFGMVGPKDEYDHLYKALPYTDVTTNRELLILECEDYRAGSFDHISILHNPTGYVDGVENIEIYNQPISVDIDGKSFILTYTSHNRIKFIDANSGEQIKTFGVDAQGTIKQILVYNISGIKTLLVLSDDGIKGYYLPDMESTDISYPNGSRGKMDIFETGGKKLLLTDSVDENLYTSDLASGELVNNPLSLVIPGTDGEQMNAVHDYKVFKSSVKQRDLVLLTYSEASESYLWSPCEDNKVTPLIIDKDMRDIISDDPDFVMVDAVATELDGKEFIFAMSHHGLITRFDIETGKRSGNIIKTGSSHENNYIKILDFHGQSILVSAGDKTVKFWNLSDNKKLKDFSFDDDITGVEVTGQKVIVCHGQNITAINVQ